MKQSRRMLRKIVLGSALGLLIVHPLIAAPNVWENWHRSLLRQCPLNRVEWVAGDGYDELIGAYSKSLPRSQSSRLDIAANCDANCGNVTNGFECEMGAYLNAAQQLGMLRDMAKFSCHVVHCEEPGLCSRFPHVR